MKYVLLVFFSLLMFVPLAGQENERLSNHELGVDFGSYRNRYLYPITNIHYRSPTLSKVNVMFSARLRSYGTLYFFSKSAYDFTPLAEYVFLRNEKSIFFSAGLGLDARLRLVNDERSTATSSVEPLICATIHGTFAKCSFNVPVWTRLYSNGISFTALPNISYAVGKKMAVFVRDEWSLLSIYQLDTREWRHDVFIGARYSF